MQLLLEINRSSSSSSTVRSVLVMPLMSFKVYIVIWSLEHTRRFTETGSQHLNVEPLSREHRDTQIEKDTEPTIYRSQQCATRSGLRAGKIKGVVTVYNKTIKRSCFIYSFISYRDKICIKQFNNGAQSHCLLFAIEASCRPTICLL